MNVLAISLLLLATRHRISGESSLSQECGGSVSSPAVLAVPAATAVQRCRWLVLPPPSSTPYCGVILELSDPPILPPCPSTPLYVDRRPFCGQLPSTVRLPFRPPHTSLEFRSPAEGSSSLNLTVRHEQCPPRCGGEFSALSLTLQSPGYPSGYRPRLDCLFVIHPSHPGVCQIQIQFENSSLPKSTDCSKDFLKIGGEKLCGDLVGVRAYDLSEKLEIRFVSDFESGGKGFKLYARQVECTDTIAEVVDNNNDKQDVVDCEPLLQNPIGSHQGYPYVRAPYPPFPLPNTRESAAISGYLPPDDCDNSRINLKDPLLLPPYRANQQGAFQPHAPFWAGTVGSVPPAFKEQAPSSGYLPPTNLETNFQRGFFFNPDSKPLFSNFSPANKPGFQNYQPSYAQNYPTFPQPNGPNFSPSYRPPHQNYQPINTPDFQQTDGNQCCGVSYSDSHFLLPSPGFPRSEASNCVYVIRRYSQLTFQVRFQFRYFWTGVDSGNGCSGGYLEIDGTRFCGCKTGLSWSTQFSDSESAKVLHLKLDSNSNRLFNGFVLEVFQDDSYARSYRDAGERSPAANISQLVETRVERYPLTTDNASSRLFWDPSRQAWSSPDSLCLRWSLQDWLLLAKEALWAQYQCPVVTATTLKTRHVTDSTSVSTDCLVCRQFCRGNCQCC